MILLTRAPSSALGYNYYDGLEYTIIKWIIGGENPQILSRVSLAVHQDKFMLRLGQHPGGEAVVGLPGTYGGM